MKILYIGNKLSAHGNTATSIETLGAFLESEGYTLYYASSQKNQVLRMLDMVFSTVKYARKVDFVLIDTYSTRNFWYAVIISQLCRILRLKYITKLHGGNLPQRLEKDPFWCGLLFNHAYKITAPSQYLLNSFSAKGYANLEYVPNSVAISKYPFRLRKIKSPRLLWVRSFASIYNPQMAIRLLAILQKKFPDATLCMVGPDKEHILQQCRKLASELGVTVIFTGKLSKEEWIRLSEKFNIFINTTHFDNTPVSIIEAMALGLPVVSTEVGGLPFLITHNENGLLSPDGDIEAMAASVEKLLQDEALASYLAHQAREMVLSFDWQSVRQKWFEILKPD